VSFGGNVDSVLTVRTQRRPDRARLFLRAAIRTLIDSGLAIAVAR
jgi:hypothetical protein